MTGNLQSIREDFASRFLAEALRFLKSQKPSERNPSGMVIAGIAAFLLSDKTLFREFEQIWDNTPIKDYRAGKQFEEAVTNSSYLKDNKVMSKEEFREYLQKIALERLEICLNTNTTLEDVLQIANSQLDIEEFGCTFAVLGNYEMAQKVANSTELEKFRQDGILWTIEAEKLREGNFANPDLSNLGLQDSGVDPWKAGYVALCALGRLPYMGYPYPDW